MVVTRVSCVLFFSTEAPRGTIMKEDPKPGLPLPKAGGPRTVKGKMRSKKNSLTHGISAIQLLLEDESQEEFSSLCWELQENVGAKGALEEAQILHLAMLLLRMRRMLKAETAEIRKTAEFLSLDHLREQIARASNCNNELVAQRTNPLALKRIIGLLNDLRYRFDHEGFNVEHDVAILSKIYGIGHLKEGFPLVYIGVNAPIQGADKPGETPRKSGLNKKEMLTLFDEEIARFEGLKNAIEQVDSAGLRYAERASLVPHQEVLERLLRYESHLSREIDRVLNRLERLKRSRLHLPMPPSITLTAG
jgi:hypothetical protein